MYQKTTCGKLNKGIPLTQIFMLQYASFKYVLHNRYYAAAGYTHIRTYFNIVARVLWNYITLLKVHLYNVFLHIFSTDRLLLLMKVYVFFVKMHY